MTETPQSLTGLQKAAIVLVSLGSTDGAKVMQHIPEEEANRLAEAIALLDRIPPEQVQSVLGEFAEQAASDKLFVRGSFEYAEKVLIEAYGSTVAKVLVEKLQKSSMPGFNFERFVKADPQQFAKLIQDEHPQTIALVLSHLNAAQAAALLSCLPVEIRAEVAARIAGLDQISPEIVRHIATTIEQKLSNMGEFSRQAGGGGVRAVADIFKRLDPNTCLQLMDVFEKQKQPLFADIRQFMFVFRDLEILEPAALSLILSKAPRASLVIALKGASESLRQKFVGTQSQRGAAMLLEEIGSLGPVRLRDVDAAQQEIVNIARELEEEGAISLKNSDDEQYID